IERNAARDEARRVAAQLDEAQKREAELREAIESPDREAAGTGAHRRISYTSAQPETVDEESGLMRTRKWVGWRLVEPPRARVLIACLGTAATIIGGFVATVAGLAAIAVATLIVLGTGI